MSSKLLALVGPGESASSGEIMAAERIAELAARAGWVVLCGGRDAGVMRAAAQGTARGGGISIGLLPSADRTEAAPELTVALATGLGEARNAVLAQSCDAMVACGTSPGTASEIMLALKARKPVVLVQPDRASREFFQAHGLAVRLAASPEAVIELLRTSS